MSGIPQIYLLCVKSTVIPMRSPLASFRDEFAIFNLSRVSH
jgi:hypothetical protein